MRRHLLIFSVLFLAAAPFAAFSVSAQTIDRLSSLSIYPNPFDSRTQAATIEYSLNGDASVSIDLYNVFGIKLRGWTHQPGADGGRRGVNRLIWRGRDDVGVKVSKGIYFAVVRAGGARRVRMIGVIH